MPIPLPGPYRRSNLKKEQQKEQLAACYGVTMPKEITPVEAEQLRSILQRYDNDHKPVAIHNLNDPPKTQYRYQKFPKILYNHHESEPAHEVIKSAIVGNSVVEEAIHVRAKVVTMVVQNEEALEAALADGWSENPPEYREEPEEVLSAKYQSEAEAADAQLHRKPGRPRKQ